MAEVIRIGVFFDGTGANMWNDKKIDDGSITNVGKVYDLYEKAYKKSTEEEKKDFAEPLYNAGIGTLKYTKDNTFTDEQVNTIREAAEKDGNYIKKIDFYNLGDMAVGTGAKDISNNALNEIKEKINDLKKESPNSQIVIDVHGFSRGAATSRDFINSFNEHYKNDENVKVDYVGLYDTVATIGTKHDIYNGGLNLNLNSNSANKIVHLVANDERRLNFPLYSFADKYGNLPENIKEIALYGVHGDIGGGDPHFYKDNIIKDYGTKEFNKDNNVDKENVINSIKKVAEEKGHDEHMHIEDALSIIQYVYTKEVDKTNELGKANLNIMLNEIKNHGVNLPDTQNLGKDYSVPENLKGYVEGVKNGEDISRYENDVKNYISISGGSIILRKDELRQDNLISSFVNLNKNEREIFSNKPEKAFFDSSNFTLEEHITKELGISKNELNVIVNSKELQQELQQTQKELEQNKASKENSQELKEVNTNSNVHMSLHR